ncbi:MAG: DNA-binding transcriptional MerR regulator [Zhongshania marina]|jgi:DNA-binding transcriptional MerR regulator|uniref:MerR family transcriptional regulator n=1 Tax=Zhongshania marina TaxID=2304603 RepID=A0A2S4HGX8_9GAMM|nr:MerR family transcriptional regulator [Marortus luteolus]POP53237.1 MerR family transcriptional regulator [Marortus luteolus]RNL58698.1 MerR family transcriptional regulator [Zhongshania marina]
MKFPEDTISSMAQLLPQNGFTNETQAEHQRDYSVEELALAANTTVRNIRAYQDRGVLPPPALQGRKGVYNNFHLSRLRLIANLLDRGYTLSSIRELIAALEEGIGLSEVLGIESALNSPWTNESPTTIAITELAKMFGTKLTPSAVKTAHDLGLFTISGTKLRVSSMNTLKVAEELCATGIPLDELLDILRMMRGNVQRVANEFVKLISQHVLEPYAEQKLPPPEELPKIAELIWRLRPLAEKVVDAELGRAMEIAASEFLADTLESIMEDLPKDVPSKG